MASLKEIKGRIASVNSTLKITSAMKMVASARLRKAQEAIGNMVPYEERLQGILVHLLSGLANVESDYINQREEISNVAIVALASNSSLCGAFNANAIKEAVSAAKEYKKAGIGVTVYSIGRKMADAMKKAGFRSPADYSKLSDKPTYAGAAEIGRELMEGYVSGKYDKVEIIWNHYKSNSSQPTTRETYLPLKLERGEEDAMDGAGYIVEPDAKTMVEKLLPVSLLLKIYTVLLDSAAAEHAARTVAMQTATDNGNDLLADLTLEFNKGRQAKITNEILDLEGGSDEGRE
jgi:F-type H+-transporting ATPase subunit gamma